MNGDGDISINEFLTAVRVRAKETKHSPQGEAAWAKIMDVHDKNSGAFTANLVCAFSVFCGGDPDTTDISPTELQGVFLSSGVVLDSDDMVLICNDIDDDGSGSISLEELRMAVYQRGQLSAKKRAAAKAEEAARLKRKAERFALEQAQGLDGGVPLVDTSALAWTKILDIATGRKGSNYEGTWKDVVTKLFTDFDADGSGDVDLAELGQGLKMLGANLTKKQLTALAKDLDGDGDGSVTKEEFFVAVRVRMDAKARQASADPKVQSMEQCWSKILAQGKRHPRGWKAAIEELFLEFDSDGSGEIDVGEFHAGLESLGLVISGEEAQFIFDDVDADGGGTLTLQEVTMALLQRQRMEEALLTTIGERQRAMDRKKEYLDAKQVRACRCCSGARRSAGMATSV